MLMLSTDGSTPTDDYQNQLDETGVTGTIVRSPATFLPASSQVAFDWYFTSQDYDPFHDFALGLLGSQELLSFTLSGNGDPDVNYDSGWHSASLVVPADGTYQLFFIVSNQAALSL
ncbi:MAG: hypothetical protein L0Z62_15985 [Gemmataceae bacterium]|nr:hypothetical protein [Gemmataceae bacterium]